MEAVFAIIGGALLFWLMSRINHHESEENEEYTTTTVNEQPKNTMNDSKNEYEGMDVPTLMQALLKNLNCQYEADEYGNLTFTFQAENFTIYIDKGSSWIRIVDHPWYDCPLDKFEEISCMQRSINSVNAWQQCTAVYSIDKEDNKMIVFSKCDLLMHSGIPALEQYLYAWLNSFFRLKQAIVTEFEKAKQKIETKE